MVVMSNVRGRDLGSFVKEVEQNIAHDVKLPVGYSIEYGASSRIRNVRQSVF